MKSIKYHELVSAATGLKMSYDDMIRTGERIVTMERALNTRFGIRRKDDTLPRRFLKDAIPSGPTKGERFDAHRLRTMVDEYYGRRGWDKKSGLLVKDRLEELGLKDVANDLAKRRLLAPAGKKAGKKR